MTKITVIAQWVFLILFVLAAPVQAQTLRGAITGSVTDPTDAVVPGAEVTLTFMDKGITVGKFTTGNNGVFRFGNLDQGNYAVAATAKGFQKYEQKGIVVHVNEVLTADVRLAVGAAIEMVEVTGQASALNFENGELKATVPSQALDELPLRVAGGPRTAATFVQLLPGVMGIGGNYYDIIVNGGGRESDDGVLDGVSVVEGAATVSGVTTVMGDQPITPEAVSEVTLITSNYDPQYGTATGGVLTMVTKSGTNQIHGEAREFLHNTVLNARQFNAPTRPPDIENEYGFNVGGPVRGTHIPGVWSAKRKSFFFFNWDRWVIRGSPTRPVSSLPTAQERSGDFSDWKDASGKLIPIYDPATTRANPNYNPSLAVSATNQAFLRDQFMGCDGAHPNVICGNDPRLLNSLAPKWLQFLPTPNQAGLVNNWVSTYPFVTVQGRVDHRNAWDLRLDHYEGEKDHFNVVFHYHIVVQSPIAALPPQLATQSFSRDGNSQGPWLNRASWDHTFSPTLVNTFNIGYNVERGHSFCTDAEFADTLPKISGVYGHNAPPALTFDDYSSLGCSNGPAYNARPVISFNDTALKNWGHHLLKFGIEVRAKGANNVNTNNEAGTFTFTRLNTGLQGVTSGNAFASFLLGYVGSATASYYSVRDYYIREKDYALYIGDTWRATPRMTVNLGVRWDVVKPSTEKYDRQSFLDPARPNPGAGNLPGALVFAGSSSLYGNAAYGARYPEAMWYGGFGPRIGLAYTVSNRTVVRGGFGLFFGGTNYAVASLNGFNLTPATFSSSNGGLTPAFTLSQGVPQTFTPPPFFSTTYLNGQAGPVYRAPDGDKLPYMQQWNLTIEHRFANDLYVGTSYIGNKGTRLLSQMAPLNALDPKYLSLGQKLFDQFTAGQTTLDGVNAPYPGFATSLAACAPSVAQALMPFPQYCGNLLAFAEHQGNSTFESFQMKVEKRASKGVWFLGAYTLSKFITSSIGGTTYTGSNTNLISPYQRYRNKALSPDDVPNVISLSMVYALPFGKGQHFLNHGGALDKLVGGWSMNNIVHWQSGFPYRFTSSFCNVPTQLRAACLPGVLPGANVLQQSPGSFDPAKGPLFNKTAFEPTSAFNFYTGTGSLETNYRSASYYNHDVTVVKNVRLTERFNLQIRAEAFNLWNLHRFVGTSSSSAFVMDVSSPSFGTWSGTVSAPRNLQLGMKLQF